MPDDVALGLYRIAQEALQNVVQHAHARSVQVRLLENEFEVRLEIADDGHGFQPGQHDQSGLGLLSMRERVALLRGRLFIDSLPGSGTRIVVRVPKRQVQPLDAEPRFALKTATALH
jgi:signal transduction histidine kinase